MDENNRPHLPADDTDAEYGCASHGNADSPQDLKPFADQLMAIAKQLREGEFQSMPPIAVNGKDGNASASAPGDLARSRSEYAEIARRTYAIRRQRGAIFGNAELFGEPAWDILLDLYVAYTDGNPVSVSSACIGSAAPPTTGLRWLGVLAEHDLVVREQDPDDQRRVLVRLTDRGVEAMDRYFASAVPQQNNGRAVSA
ncbi:MAG: winged helix DNA-binding protein [Pseudomonadota bacterium]